jgi:predicted PurR-regulated permease PerM
VVLALVFWLWLWGPLGGFIAIPALLVAYAIIRHIFPGVDWPGKHRLASVPSLTMDSQRR